jgi:NADH-quinone oxidoreductase subunit H
VVGLLMGSWASNSKWSLFGGIRSAAQIVSYEIPAGLSLLVPVLMTGTLSTQGLISAQGGLQDGNWLTVGGWPWNWTLFANPMAFVAFFIFMTSLLAEGNRVPFDLPEAESELVAGYNTEYSGMRFGVFFLVEFGNNYVMGALASILFLGGWQLPGVTEAHLRASVGLEILAGALFLFKVIAVTTGVIWVGWTMPRIRVDQMMELCWKYLVPISMVLVVFTAASLWLLKDLSPMLLEGSRFLFFLAAGAVPVFFFLKQTFKNIRLAGDKVDLSNW